MPTSPYLTDQYAPLTHTGHVSTWQTVSTVLNIVGSTANLIGSIYNANYRSDYAAETDKLRKEMEDRDGLGLDGAGLLQDTQNRIKETQADTTLSDGQRAARMDMYDRYYARDNSKWIAQRDMNNKVKISNMATMLDTINMSPTEVTNYVNDLAKEYKLQPAVVRQSLVTGAVQSNLEKLKTVAESGNIEAYKAQVDLNNITFEKFGIHNLMRAPDTPQGQYYTKLNNDYNRGSAQLLKSMSQPYKDYIDTSINTIKKDPMKINEVDLSKMEQSFNILKQASPDSARELYQQWQTQSKKATEVKHLVDNNSDMTVPAEPQALANTDFKAIRTQKVYDELGSPTSYEHKAKVIGANQSLTSNISKYYENLATSNPQKAYGEYRSYMTAKGGPKVANVLFKQDTINNLTSTKAVMALSHTEDGKPISWAKASDMVIKAETDPAPMTSIAKRSRDKFNQTLAKMNIPEQAKSDYRKQADVAFKATGNAEVYDKILNMNEDSVITVDGVQLYTPTVPTQNEALVADFKNTLASQYNVPESWVEDNTYVTGDGAGGAIVYQSDPMGVFGSEPLMRISPTDIQSYQNQETAVEPLTEVQKKRAVIAENLLADVTTAANLVAKSQTFVADYAKKHLTEDFSNTSTDFSPITEAVSKTFKDAIDNTTNWFYEWYIKDNK